MSQLLEDEQIVLLQIAREAVRSYLSEATPRIPYIPSGALTEPRALFVSLHRGSKLRGCIGNIYPSDPLYRTVAECAISAAVGDPRFEPLNMTDLNQVTFEISVLSPMELVQRPEEIDVGKHGLLISKQQARGLLLPQVASQNGWNRDRFLSETCRKAGLQPNDWKEGATIHRFTAQIFTEQKIHAA
jgi:AmmeMemoRadiSam system protein A